VTFRRGAFGVLEMTTSVKYDVELRADPEKPGDGPA
jgi:hypothetical protein